LLEFVSPQSVDGTMDVCVPLLSMARRIAALLGAAALMALTAGGYARARDAVSAVRVDWRVLHCATTVRRPLSAALAEIVQPRPV